MWTHIRMLLQDQSDLGLRCFVKYGFKTFQQRTKQTTFVVNGFSIYIQKQAKQAFGMQ